MIVVLVGIFSIVGCEKNEEYSGKKVENSYIENEESFKQTKDLVRNASIIGALTLYLDFAISRKK